MNYVLSAAIAIIIVWSCDVARAAEVTLIAPGGIRAAVQQLIPAFERATGHKVNATFGSGGGTKERVIKGEPFEVPIVQPPLEPVIASGHVVAASETPLATVAVGIVNPAPPQFPISVCKMPAVPLIVKLSATMTTHDWPWAALSTAPFRVTLACGI